MKVQGLKGTRDFYPEEMRTLNYIFSVWRSVANRFGYEEFDGPMLEPVELWNLKSGGELPEQMYRFKDKSGSEVVVRPELTPTLARMVAQKQKELAKPIRWFSIPRCWRYEAPQSGRLREFFQLNIDCLGVETMQADAEVIATAIEIMKAFGCTSNDFYVRLCNRKLISSLLRSAGISHNLHEVCRVIDKKDKLSEREFSDELARTGLVKKQIDDLVRLLDSSLGEIHLSEIDEEGKKGHEELKQLMVLLSDYGIAEYCKIDFSIMRGFDYYTSTVFEIYDKTREFRAIAGGGRYDDLVKDFGGEKCPGIGYGMGDVVLELFLKKLKKLPSFERSIDFYVAPVSPNLLGHAIKICQKLREKFSAEIDLSRKNLRKQMDFANSMGAKKIVIVGEKDIKAGKVTIKDMKSGKESRVSLAKL